jgi:plasminogen activator inhibitor 1 RNA-binding protein
VRVCARASDAVGIHHSRNNDASDRHHGKHGRGGRVAPRNGKRAYERRSGTGRGKEIKKDGDGAHNWGSDKNEARSAQGSTMTTADVMVVDEVTEYAEDNDDQRVAEQDDELEAGGDYTSERQPEEEPRPEPVVDNTISYEDYLKAKAAEASASSGLLAPVKPREVVDEFANIKPAIAQEEDFLVLGGGKSKRKKEGKPAETPAAAAALLAGLRVAPGGNDGFRGSGRLGGRGERGRGRGGDGERGRGRGGADARGRGGERGGRGRGRGGRDYSGGRGGGRSGRGFDERGGRGGRGSNFVNVHDETAFPSL